MGLLILSFLAANGQHRKPLTPTETIDLAGDWNFKCDPSNEGVSQSWYSGSLPDKVRLPGSMTTNHLGNEISVHTIWTGSILDSSFFFKPAYAKYRVPGHVKVPFWLQPEKYYRGAAWYQKTINVPASWKGRHLQLYLERAHWQTEVWLDDQQKGTRNSLGTPHIYDLGTIRSAGKHRITIRVDNEIRDLDVGQNSHSISDHTQTNWNGLIGQMYVKVLPAAYITNVQLYPDIDKKQVVAAITVKNYSDASGTIGLDLSVRPTNKKVKTKAPGQVRKMLNLGKKDTTYTIVYPMGQSPLLWSEAHPNLYSFSVSLSRDQAPYDHRSISFGMRKFSTSSTNFLINGQPTMLRGTLECAVFPKTGFPPTDVGSWIRELKKCKDYGLNHLRFHSWCPPEAAFHVADSLGLYLQIECSTWAGWTTEIGDGKPIDEYIYEESQNMINNYGNHPSFCLLAYGNEPSGKNQVDYLEKFVTYWQAKDPRRLYTTCSGWPIIKESDYNSTGEPRIAHGGPIVKTVINAKAPSTDYDWSSIISHWQHPTVSHEIGQWCVYPDFDEIAKYTGVLKAKNFEIFRDTLQENGLGSLGKEFLFASGKLQTLCYKADIEAALRTKGFGGFQLLGLSDFPGQGSALVGVLNAFWEDKPYINSGEFSRFCNKVVPLARFPKLVYTNDETLNVPVEIAQFSERTLKQVSPQWDIQTETGKILLKGQLSRQDIRVGNGIPLGKIESALTSLPAPSHLILNVRVAGYENSWDFFVYPAHTAEKQSDILVTQTLDSKALETLQHGGKVLLTLKQGTLNKHMGGDIKIGFSSIFWNTAWVQSPPYSLGILCDPAHPALSNFPTQKYSNWEWWDGMSHGNAIKLDSLSKGIKPIVRVIDDWFSARSLGLIFECRAAKGKLIVSGIDLLSDANDRPEARQLLYSLEHYMSKAEFAPQQTVPIQRLKYLTD